MQVPVSNNSRGRANEESSVKTPASESVSGGSHLYLYQSIFFLGACHPKLTLLDVGFIIKPQCDRDNPSPIFAQNTFGGGHSSPWMTNRTGTISAVNMAELRTVSSLRACAPSLLENNNRTILAPWPAWPWRRSLKTPCFEV
jgi:hypothetical protein